MQTEHFQSDGTRFGADVMPIKDMPEGGSDADFTVINEQVLLRGSRSQSSGVRSFPYREVCPETGVRDMEPVTIGPEGRLYSFSTVHVSATRLVPYTVGYVDFPDGVRVLAQVRANEAELNILACNAPVVLRAEGAEWYVIPLPSQGADK